MGAGSAASGSARRPSRRVGGMVGSAALVAVAVAGCGGTAVKGSSAEQSIKGFLGGSATAVKCPKSIPYKQGKTFTCSVTSQGKTGKIVVQMQKKTGNTVPFKPLRLTGF
ncbi:MAG TPA: DUF4333 domain-containing protein [Solirubrobacteraceae bacterium]|nr:DUF4333 domain-containing protein [Solirubrobacteraceae bacterium]